MKKTVLALVIMAGICSCDTPNNVIGNPNGAGNTTGSTGSGNMTNNMDNSNGVPVTKTTPGTGSDSTTAKKDSLPQ
jgi:hypothetical protein